MSDKRVGPLGWNVPIVDKNGRPTPEFMRKWTLQSAINGGIPSFSTTAEVSAVLDILGGTRGDLLRRGATEWGVLHSPADATQFLNGGVDPTWGHVHDSDLSVSDITNNNVSIAAHGFVPKAPNDATMFLNGLGAWAPAGGGGGGDVVLIQDDILTNATDWVVDLKTPRLAGYLSLEVRVQNWQVPATNSGMRCRFGIGSPPVYHTGGGAYYWAVSRLFGGGGTGVNGGLNDHMEMDAGNGINQAAYGGMSNVITLQNFWESASFTRLGWQYDLWDVNGYPAGGWGVGANLTIEAPDAMKLYIDNGNIVKGTGKVFAYK